MNSRCVTVSALQSPVIVKQPQLPVYIQTDSDAQSPLKDDDEANSGLNCLEALKRKSGLASTEALLNLSIEQASLTSKLEATEEETTSVAKEEEPDLELSMTGFSIDAIRSELTRIKNHKEKVDKKYKRVMSQLKSPDPVAKYSR